MKNNAIHGIGQREFSAVFNTTQQEDRRLWRDKGRPVVANLFGSLRYLYNDGTFDQNSLVDPRVEHVRAKVTEQLVAITDKHLPDFAETWRRQRIVAALRCPDGQKELNTLGARILVFDMPHESQKEQALTTPQVLPDEVKSNIIALSLPETATGQVRDERLDKVA